MKYIFIILIIIALFYIINNIIKVKYIENFSDSTPFPIDIVYTWKGEDFSNNIRESYNYELQYSLRSVYLYAKWINKIYILTDPFVKRPSWIKDSYNKIIMVDTSETFTDKKYLPNSNSNAIETTIANIKGLSEHYIYFCDDIFLGRETSFTDFFTKDGKALIDKRCTINNSIVKTTSNINLPDTVNRFYPHIPIPQIKSLVKEFYETYPEYTEWIRTTKTRQGDGREFCIKNNFNFPCQQIHYPICKFMLSKNKALLFNYDAPNIKIFIMNDTLNENKLETIIKTKPLFFCINDDEKNPIKRIKVRKEMLEFFQYYYNVKPFYEK